MSPSCCRNCGTPASNWAGDYGPGWFFRSEELNHYRQMYLYFPGVQYPMRCVYDDRTFPITDLRADYGVTPAEFEAGVHEWSEAKWETCPHCRGEFK